MFKGSIVALITPFKNDALDTNNYIKLLNHHIEKGTKNFLKYIIKKLLNGIYMIENVDYVLNFLPVFYQG